MPEWRRRAVEVTLVFLVDGSESDGTAVDLITGAVGTLGEMKAPRSDGHGDPGEAGLYVRRPSVKSITIAPGSAR